MGFKAKVSHYYNFFGATTHSLYASVRSGLLRFGQILKNPNPELDLGFGSVHPVSPNLNWGLVQV
jgi:hypothetical protein